MGTSPTREPSFLLSWTGEQLYMPTRGLLSRVMGVATRSRPAFSPGKALLEWETVFLLSAPATPPSARVFSVDGVSWVIDEGIPDILG